MKFFTKTYASEHFRHIQNMKSNGLTLSFSLISNPNYKTMLVFYEQCSNYEYKNKKETSSKSITEQANNKVIDILSFHINSIKFQY